MHNIAYNLKEKKTYTNNTIISYYIICTIKEKNLTNSRTITGK